VSFNSFGKIFKITTFGESHGNSVGVIIDGCPSGIHITDEEIQLFVDQRKGGKNNYTTKRAEDDKIEILSGIYQNKTLGTPIAIIVKNKDIKSEDYENILTSYRPSHADFSWHKKFTHVDPRGGGRSSARETIARVIGGAIALKILDIYNIKIIPFIKQIGNISINAENINYDNINNNIFKSPDESVVSLWQNILDQAVSQGDSIGGVIEIHIKNTPIGLGEPVFEKLNANLAKALFTIPAVKGVEFGEGFNLVKKQGSNANDELESINNTIKFKTNNNGGILGGISTGEDIVIKVGIKPASSIATKQNTVDHNGNNISINIKGRHDAFIALRALSVCKAMCALVIADNLLINKIRNLNIDL
jgi:chorismate synthase